jgi:hypothetical protein
MVRVLTAVLLAGVSLGILACKGEEPRPIRVGTDRVTVINLTDTAWRDVEVWLNDHYRVQQRDLVPGQRLEIPLGVFVAAYGRNFDPKKQVPFGIEVAAVAADGKPVTIVWGKGRRR